MAGTSIVFAMALPGSAGAHGLLVESAPAEGARLTAPPEEVLLTFTEAPETSLSSIQLLDTAGGQIAGADPKPVPADPAALSLPLPNLEQGVYTVTWRIVSKVDGHPTAGAFAFGVGVSPAGAPTVAADVEIPEPSPLEMAGRLVFYLGLGILLGAGWVGAFAFGEVPSSLRRAASWSWAVAAVGLLVLGFSQYRGAEVSLGEFLPTTPGRALLYRAGAMAVAGAGLLAATLWPASRRRALLVAGAGGAVAILAHVAAGHAAARGDIAWAKVLAQWVHFVAAAVWLGGLGALLVGIRGKPDDAKARAVRRFSLVAGVALAAVVLTGVVRSINEVGSWGALFSTGYGIAVLVKAGLILALAGLGAVNRFRNVAHAATSLGALRRVSRGELTLAVSAAGAAAVLATLVPPAQVPEAAGAPPGISVAASDFARTVRVELEVAPGTPGPNRFEVRATDPDSGDAVEAQRVALRFGYEGTANIQDSSLDLQPQEEGAWSANGSNLSVGGPWSATVLVQQGADSVEVPLDFATVCNALRIEAPKPNQPTVSTIDTPDGGSVEGYVLELGGERYEVHFTFIEPDGKETAVEGLPVISAWQRGAPTMSLDPIPLTRGHFLAEAQLGPGSWRFDGSARSGGTSAVGCFEEELP